MRYRHIIFDFDGVLIESNEIKLEGFRLLFSGYPERYLEDFLSFSRLNGGLSRYEKIRYFFEKIQSKSISKSEVNILANQYSKLIKTKVMSARPVKGAIEFLSFYHKTYDFAVVSASDQDELIEICKGRRIDHFFIDILGSPVGKRENVSMLFLKREWEKDASLFVGDSLNDLEVAQLEGIDFIARDSGIVDWNVVNNVIVIKDISELCSQLLK